MRIFTILVFIFNFVFSFAQDKKSEGKKGWSLGAVPAVSFNSDQGFQYGGLVNFFDYGDGVRYPNFDHSFYLEISRFTSGGGINRFSHISDRLIPGIIIASDISYLTEKAMDFWGFNGYEAIYNVHWEDDTHSDYKSRMFYKHERALFRFKSDFIIPSGKKNLNILAGIALYDFKIGSIDPNGFRNELPNTNGIYEKYIQWNVIEAEEKDGGFLSYFKVGIQYDSRDNFANPNKGIWSEAMVRYAPGNLSNGFDHSKVSFIHHQYLPIVYRKLTLAYRLHYQYALHGKTPFYALPIMATSQLRGATSQGLGGSASLRGILRNKIVGEGFALANVELRYKPFEFSRFKQNFYIGTNLFYDAGIITQKRTMDFELIKSNIESSGEVFENYFNPDTESLHGAVGFGLYLAMNENFVLAIDYGQALNKQDGNTGLYINLNYLF